MVALRRVELPLPYGTHRRPTGRIHKIRPLLWLEGSPGPPTLIGERDRERLRPLFQGKRTPQSLAAAVTVAGEALAHDPTTGCAVLSRWIEDLLELRTAPPPLTAETAVQQMRVVLSRCGPSTDWALLGATLAYTLLSAPTAQHLALQSATGMDSLWPALISAVSATQNVAELADVLDCLAMRFPAPNAAPSWLADEMSSLPGAPATSSPTIPPAPRVSHPPPTPPMTATQVTVRPAVPQPPRSASTCRLVVGGIRGLVGSTVADAFVSAAAGCGAGAVAGGAALLPPAPELRLAPQLNGVLGGYRALKRC